MSAKRSPSADRSKPCGILAWCPLVDEGRFFAEGEESLQQRGLSRERSRSLVHLALARWCRGHARLGLRPDLAACRATLAEAVAEAVAVARPSAGQSVADALAATLSRELRVREQQEATAREIGAALFPEGIIG